MTVTLTNLFDFFAQNPKLRARRETFVSPNFTEVRYCFRGVVEELHDVEDDLARQLSSGLQRALLEWLTAPKPFETDILQGLVSLGTTAQLEARWGSELGRRIRDAKAALQLLCTDRNPLRLSIAETVANLRREGRQFRVFCHRTAVEHYQTALTDAGFEPLSESLLLHSILDYRETELFDVLIKVGPLKVRGWGSAPDALVTAPKFLELRTFVWEGAADDPDFGYDPADIEPNDEIEGTDGAQSHGRNVAWNTRVHGAHLPSPTREQRALVDEFNLFRELSKRDGLRKAVLVALSGGHGVLLTPNSHVTVLAVNGAGGAIRRGSARELLCRGSFLVRPQLGSIDLGGTRAELGSFSRRWKERLSQLAEADRAGLVERLRRGGLDLFRLSDAIHHWLKPPTTVIHAPQQIRHFKVLIEVLGLNGEIAHNAGKRAWWELAWEEISRSRGVAIRDGVIEQDIREQECISALEGRMAEIVVVAMNEASFRFAFPPGSLVSGLAMFDKVEAVEDGFMVPEGELTILRDLKEADQWRA